MRDESLAVMLFAAGFGTRMRHLTKDRPKPLIKVAGNPLIDHALDLAQATHPPRIVANLHYLPDQLEAHLAPRGVTTVIETPNILDTGGGLRNALDLLGTNPVITMNTDAIWVGPNPLAILLKAWDPDRMDALLIGIEPARASGHPKGDFDISGDGLLTRGSALIYGGIQIIKTDLLADIPDEAFSLNVVWDLMLGRKRLYGATYPGDWCDVGHPEGIAMAEALLEQSDV